MSGLQEENGVNGIREGRMTDEGEESVRNQVCGV